MPRVFLCDKVIKISDINIYLRRDIYHINDAYCMQSAGVNIQQSSSINTTNTSTPPKGKSAIMIIVSIDDVNMIDADWLNK